jgi:hypothetical protein
MRISDGLRDRSGELSQRTMTDHILVRKARLLERVKQKGLSVSDTGLGTSKETE